MHSAPISRAAVIVFSRCCATSVSTVATPVMSMIATREFVATIACSSVSITTCVRALSSVPISGRATMPSHSVTTGVDSSSMSSCCRTITCSRPLMKLSVVIRPSLSTNVSAMETSSNSLSMSVPHRLRICAKSTGFNDRMNSAVSDGVKPSVARARRDRRDQIFQRSPCRRPEILQFRLRVHRQQSRQNLRRLRFELAFAQKVSTLQCCVQVSGPCFEHGVTFLL